MSNRCSDLKLATTYLDLDGGGSYDRRDSPTLFTTHTTTSNQFSRALANLSVWSSVWFVELDGNIGDGESHGGSEKRGKGSDSGRSGYKGGCGCWSRGLFRRLPSSGRGASRRRGDVGQAGGWWVKETTTNGEGLDPEERRDWCASRAVLGSGRRSRRRLRERRCLLGVGWS
ncbi:uncharacterized protein A4U43_C03F21310 [Asparagus officinalis]|uniref:Uncharacterized protein n=1 Tax=Asparagus officinalis TaxID=4686 RepID=A0A5P1FGZ6_ASPOF|nr:uncharacterized protein A4U43_C03F21310 [Asparagus officinalis]